MVKAKLVGKCEILGHNDKDLTCSKKDCEIIKKLITNGMYCVEVNNNFYHAACAKQLGIDFKVPLPKKRKTEK